MATRQEKEEAVESIQWKVLLVAAGLAVLSLVVTFLGLHPVVPRVLTAGAGALLAFNTFKGSVLGARTRKGSAGVLKLVSSGLALVAVHQLPPYPDFDS